MPKTPLWHPPGVQPVGIVDIFDSRVPNNLSQESTFDYLFLSQKPSASDIHSVAPAGTNIPAGLLAGDFGALQGTQTFAGDNGVGFTSQKNTDGTTTLVAVDPN